MLGSATNGYVLITGASSGIGDAVARRLARTHPLILHGRDAGRLEALRAALPNAATHMLWNLDFGSAPDVGASLVALIAGAGIGVETVIHCAGEVRIAPVKAATHAEVQRMFRVNYFSATAILRELLKRSVNNQSLKSAVFMSSVTSRFGAKGFGIYAATKGALDTLMRSLAAELAPRIRLNSVLAGGIRTRGTEFLYQAAVKRDSDQGYLLGPGCPDDVAAMVAYLISDEARWITGQQFVIDGGMTAH